MLAMRVYLSGGYSGFLLVPVRPVVLERLCSGICCKSSFPFLFVGYYGKEFFGRFVFIGRFPESSHACCAIVKHEVIRDSASFHRACEWADTRRGE
jgi:hypothetical protein